MWNVNELREALLAAMTEMDRRGLNRGSSGNASVRIAGGLLITPSGIAASQLTSESIVPMDLNGQPSGHFEPSSEWRFHRDIYAARSDVHAIVHCHSPFATTLACLGKDVPPFHYMIAVAGDTSIRCAPYATFGTQQLSDHALRALEGRRACLLANHGMICCGADLAGAAALAVEVEALCEQYWRALAVGEPVILSDVEMATVLEKFRTYGRRK